MKRRSTRGSTPASKKIKETTKTRSPLTGREAHGIAKTALDRSERLPESSSSNSSSSSGGFRSSSSNRSRSRSRQRSTGHAATKKSGSSANSPPTPASPATTATSAQRRQASPSDVRSDDDDDDDDRIHGGYSGGGVIMHDRLIDGNDAAPSPLPSPSDLVDYQETPTWPSWSDAPQKKIGVQVRIFEVIEVSDAIVHVSVGFFLFWTLPDLEEAVDEVRDVCQFETDHHGFEHILLGVGGGSGAGGGRQGFAAEDADNRLACPQFAVINSMSTEEIEVDRDLTVMRDMNDDDNEGGNKKKKKNNNNNNKLWLYQYRKFRVKLTYSPALADFPLDTQTVHMNLTLREERGRSLVTVPRMPSLVFVGCSASIEKRWAVCGSSVDITGINVNRGQAHILTVEPNDYVGYKNRFDVRFQLHRRPAYFLVNYLALVWFTCCLTLLPYFMYDGGVSSKLEFTASLVLAMIAIRLIFVQETESDSELTWLDIQMLASIAFSYSATGLQIVAESHEAFFHRANEVAAVLLIVVYPVYFAQHYYRKTRAFGRK